MQEVAAAKQKVTDAAGEKAKTKKNNEQAEVILGLRIDEKSVSGLGVQPSSRSHSATNAAQSFGT